MNDPDGNGEITEINLRFPGQYADKETGLYYNWNRYYDPETGRYVTSDPIGLMAGVNTYGYVLGNPLTGVDFMGLETLFAFQQEVRAFEEAGIDRPGPSGGLSLTVTAGLAVNAPGFSSSANFATVTAGTTSDGRNAVSDVSALGGSVSVRSGGFTVGRFLSVGIVSTERFPNSEVINIDSPIGGLMIGLDNEGLTGLGISGPSAGLISITAHGQETSICSGNLIE